MVHVASDNVKNQVKIVNSDYFKRAGSSMVWSFLDKKSGKVTVKNVQDKLSLTLLGIEQSQSEGPAMLLQN